MDTQQAQRAVYLMVPMFGPWTLEIHPADAADVGAKERQGEPHTWRLSMAVREADVK